jgi:hypothetical protein
VGFKSSTQISKMFGFESAFKTPDKLQQEISSTSVFREKRRIMVILLEGEHM